MSVASSKSRNRAVRWWLMLVAALVVATLVVGGATRMTESGLSIVEWRPVTGTIPPLNQQSWQAEFDKYKTIPQYRELNRGMTLEEFKTIYWWEWGHRLLGRLIGAVYLLPFLFFLWRGWIAPRWRGWLWFIFGLGAVQGAVGWWMVASGLTERISVSQYRLAFHLTLACVIYAAIAWIVQRMRGAQSPTMQAVHSRQSRSAIALVALVLLQIYLGALVAGLDAGLTYNTWPLIDGAFIPAAERLWFETPIWRNLFENILTVQFNHRMAAYVLVAVAGLHVVDVARNVERQNALAGAVALLAVLLAQAAIGIVTLIEQVPMSLGILHQFMAVVVLTVAVVHAERLSTAAPELTRHRPGKTERVRA